MEVRTWLRRLERKRAGEVVSIAQRDGTLRIFEAGRFWQAMTMDAIAEITGTRELSPVADALAGATPEAREHVAALVGAGRGRGRRVSAWRSPKRRSRWP